MPRFVEDDGYADTFSRQWTRWKKTQQDSLNGTTIYRDRMERYTGWTMDSMRGKVVVDAGCGAGAYVDVFKNEADVAIGFDLSFAIDSAYELHGGRPNVYLAQGDIFRPPIRAGVADRVFSFGVVQHTPDPERAFRSLIPLLKEGGEISAWVYRKHLIPQPIYWLRLLTRGMQEPQATRFVERYVPRALRLSGLLGRVPGIGDHLRRLVPVADYRGRLPLSEEQLLEWAVMDTHDGLITRYTYPQTWKDLQRWTQDLVNVRRPSSRDMSVVAARPCSGEEGAGRVGRNT